MLSSHSWYSFHKIDPFDNSQWYIVAWHDFTSPAGARSHQIWWELFWPPDRGPFSNWSWDPLNRHFWVHARFKGLMLCSVSSIYKFYRPFEYNWKIKLMKSWIAFVTEAKTQYITKPQTVIGKVIWLIQFMWKNFWLIFPGWSIDFTNSLF